MNLAGNFRRFSSTFLLVGLGLVGCSSDSEKGDSSDDELCVKVSYVTADGQSEGEATCVDYPSACANAEDGCGNGGDECHKAITALCEGGATRETCVASSLNDKLVSVDLRCRR